MLPHFNAEVRVLRPQRLHPLALLPHFNTEPRILALNANQLLVRLGKQFVRGSKLLPHSSKLCTCGEKLLLHSSKLFACALRTGVQLLLGGWEGERR